jgi:hypothetical protein
MDLVEPTLVSRWNSGRESRRHLDVIGQTGTGKSTLLLIGLDWHRLSTWHKYIHPAWRIWATVAHSATVTTT